MIAAVLRTVPHPIPQMPGDLMQYSPGMGFWDEPCPYGPMILH